MNVSDSKPINVMSSDVVKKFEHVTGLHGLVHKLRERSDGYHLLIELGHPTDRYFAIANRISHELPDEHPLKDRVFLKKSGRAAWIKSPEAKLLQRVLTESLTIGRHSFPDDFFNRYIESMSGAEDKILSNGNHFVFGRRGSGKSSLLLFALRTREADKRISAWLSMQTYERRSDLAVIIDAVIQFLRQLYELTSHESLATVIGECKVIAAKDDLTENDIRRLAPTIRDAVLPIVHGAGDIHIFIDDLHVVDVDLQPLLISVFYAFSRGNNIFLKISAIEHFTRNWDPTNRVGLEIPNDAQLIRLDLNLTAPAQAKTHIENIITAHAHYCGIPSLSALCRENVIPRLVWVGAGVPRDAINIFLQAMTNSLQSGSKKVTVTSVNRSASDNLNDKLRFISTDVASDPKPLNDLIEQIKEFCRSHRTNAFITPIVNNSNSYKSILKLIDLRLLHVISPGITPSEAGEKHIALILDYGFYVNMRIARGMTVIQQTLQTPTYRELRSLPPFRPES